MARKPSIALLLVRVLIISVLAMLGTFAVALLLGIVTLLVLDLVRGVGIDMSYAYRYVALPVAVLGFVVSFTLMMRNEVREYRRQRAMAHDLPKAA